MCSEGTIERYVNFYTDFAFKKLFGTEINKELLVSFLNASLQGKETVTDIKYIDREYLRGEEYWSRSVIDICCINHLNEHFIVEIQKGERMLSKRRSIYYSYFAIQEQAPQGEWDYKLKGIYTIVILDFNIYSDADYYHEVKLVELKTKEVFYDKLTFIYLEMPKFTKTEGELETLFDKWLYAIRNLASLMERPRILQEKVFAHLFEAAEIAKFDRIERYEYQESLKAYRDWFSVMETAEIRGMEKGMTKGREEGMAKGLEKGREEGRKEGKEEGRKEGRKEGALSTARNLKAMNIPLDTIARATGLTSEEIENL